MLTQDQLNATYREVLGRDAPTSDLAAWNNVGGSINDYRNALLDTGEYKDRWAGVTASRNALGRDPTADELARLVVPTGVYRNASGADLSGTTSWLTDMLKQSGPEAFFRPPGTQPLPAAQPPAFQTPRQQIPTQMPNTGGQPDWLGGILGQLFGGGMGGGYQTPRQQMPNNWMPGQPTGGSSGGMGRISDLFGASPGQFGSGATGGQSTNAMSNPLSASPFGRNFSTRQMGIPARTMI
jgi:hypothetical protein